MDNNTCVVDALTLVDHIHLIKRWIYAHDIRLLVPTTVPEQVEQLYQKALEAKSKPEEAGRSKPPPKTSKKDYPTFDVNPSVTREFLARARESQDDLPVEFQHENEHFSQWRSKEIMAEKQKFDDRNPASYAQTLLMKLNFSEGSENGISKAAKPKLIARESGSGQSAWKRKIPSVSDDGVSPAKRPYLSFALWQIYENGRWDGLQLHGNPVLLLSDDQEVQIFAKKVGLKCRGSAALQQDLQTLAKEQTDISTWGDLERTFGPQEKPTNLTTTEKNPQREDTLNIESVAKPATPRQYSQVSVKSQAEKGATTDTSLDSGTKEVSGVQAGKVVGPEHKDVEAEATTSVDNEQNATSTNRPWSEVVKPRVSVKSALDTETSVKKTSAKGESSGASAVAEQGELPNQENIKPQVLDVPAPIPTKSPWKKLPPPLPEPVTVLSDSRPPSRDIHAEKLEKQNFIANWVNNVQPPTQSVQLKPRSHHRNKSSQSNVDTKELPNPTPEIRPQPSMIMKRPVSSSVPSSKEQVGALTPPLTPKINGRSSPSSAHENQSSGRPAPVEPELEDSDEEVIVFNPRAKRLSSGERSTRKHASPKRPKSSGRLVPPEFPSPKAPKTQVDIRADVPSLQEVPADDQSPEINSSEAPAEDVRAETVPGRNNLPQAPTHPLANRSIGRNGRPPHFGRTHRSRQPVVPVVIDPDDFGRRALPQPGRGSGMSNGHRAGFQNGYGRGNSPRGSPHSAIRQTEPDVDFVLKSGPTRGSTRGRGKLWIP